MKPARANRWPAAVIITAAAVMLLCFAQRSAKFAALSPLPWNPPALADEADRDERVDINIAGMDELMTLPGIGEARARAILDDREANGPFRYPEDLIRVEGIGEGVLSGILDRITTGGQQSSSAYTRSAAGAFWAAQLPDHTAGG